MRRAFAQGLLLIAFSVGLSLAGCSPTPPTVANDGESSPVPIPSSHATVPSDVPRPTLSQEATKGIPTAGPAGGWITYTDGRYGFRFEYPAVYEGYDYCELSPKSDPSGDYDLLLTVGSRITLGYEVHPDRSLDQDISALTEGAQNIDVVPTPFAGAEGRFVSYRFGGTARQGLAYVGEQNGARVVLSLTPPWRCDFIDLGITEGAAFEHLVETFRFADGE
jgi:hypothetical protein